MLWAVMLGTTNFINVRSQLSVTANSSLRRGAGFRETTAAKDAELPSPWIS